MFRNTVPSWCFPVHRRCTTIQHASIVHSHRTLLRQKPFCDNLNSCLDGLSVSDNSTTSSAAVVRGVPSEGLNRSTDEWPTGQFHCEGVGV